MLISDGYSACTQLTAVSGLTHAQWRARRRQFIRAEGAESEPAAYALEAIGALYRVEAKIRERGLRGEAKRRCRLEQAEPVAERLYAWAETQLADNAFLPTNPLTKALGYLLERRTGLDVVSHANP